MEGKIIMLSEIIPTQKDKYHMFTHVWTFDLSVCVRTCVHVCVVYMCSLKA